MQTSDMLFLGVLILTAISLIVACCILNKWKQKNFEFKNEETLPLLAGRLSKIPLATNLVILGLILGAMLLIPLLPLAFMCIFLYIILILISITFGLATGLMGIVCSTVCIKRKIEGGIKYTVASSISTLISFGFLLLYLYLSYDMVLI